jgi:hypothetical protein
MTTREVIELLAPYVPLFQTALWITIIMLAAVLFRKHWAAMLNLVLARIKKGSSFKAGPLELGPEFETLEYARPHAPNTTDETQGDNWNTERTGVYQHNRGIFLTHIISPSGNQVRNTTSSSI